MSENRNLNKIMASAITASVVTSAVVVLAPSANAEVASFKDVPSNEYFYEAVNSLHARNIVKGYGDGTFRPYEILTRAQAVKIIALALDLDTTNVKDPGFKDVSNGNFAYKYICALANKGIITGYGDTFKPNDPLTRAQMAKIISMAYDFQTGDTQKLPFTDVKQGDWFANYVSALFENEITSGTTPKTFSPNKSVTRGQIVSFVYRSEHKAAKETISNISSETLTTSEGTYALSNEQKKWINPSNLAALKGAKIKLTAKNNNIEEIQLIELNAKGSLSTDTSNPYANHVIFDGKGAIVDANMTVNSDYIVMKNVTIKGDLHVGKGVGHSFFSEFTKVEGKTTIDDSLEVVNKSQGFNVAAINNSFLVAANETAARGRVVFSEFHLGDVGVDKNADVIFLSKIPGTSSVGEIVVNSNVTLTADRSVTLPKVIIAQGAKDVSINSNVTNLKVTATGEVKLSGKSDITNLSITSSANVALQTKGKVGTLETVNKETKLTIGIETKVGNLVVPSGSKPSEIVGNYDSVKGNVEQVGGTKNPDTIPAPPSNNNGGNEVPSAPAAPTGLQGIAPTSSTTSNGKIAGLDSTKVYQYKLTTSTVWISVPVSSTEIPELAAGNYEVRIVATGNTPASVATQVTIPATQQVQTQEPDSLEIKLANFKTAGPDLIQVLNVPAGATVKVYDASTNGNLIGNTTTQTGSAQIIITNGFASSLDKVYVTITENGKSESNRVEKGVPTTFPDAPETSDITVTDNPIGNDTVAVKVPLSNSEYMISVYDMTGSQLSNNIVSGGSPGEITVGISNGFANGLTEIDVAIVKISDNGTQYAESSRTRVSIPTTIEVIENLTVTSADDDNSNDQTVITAGTPDSGNEFAYKVFDDLVAANAGKPVVNEDVSAWLPLPQNGKITVADSKVVVVVERTLADNKAKKVGHAISETEVDNQLLEAIMIDGKDGVSSQDGKVETIRLKFSANIDPSTVANNSFTVDGFDIESIKVTDKNGRTPLLSDDIQPNPKFTQGEQQYITIRVTPKEGTSFTPWVTQNSPIIDVNGVTIAGIHVQAYDSAAPVITESVFSDLDQNGMDEGDQINITFSENILVYSANLLDLVNDFTLNKTTDFAFDNSDSFSLSDNVLTVTLGATTIGKLSQGTTITMSSIGNDISLIDSVGNKAKPQKEFVNELVYSNPKPIEISGILATISKLPAKTLTADPSSNNVDNELDITFTDDTEWRSKVTAVKVGDTALTAGQYSLAAGNLTINQGVIQNIGDKTITVIATGYEDSVVNQRVAAGNLNAANSSVSLSNQLAVNSTSTVTVTARDQYNNPVSGVQFKYDFTVTNANTANNEAYIIDNKSTANTGALDIFISTITGSNGEVQFNVTLPGVVDDNDGIVIKVKKGENSFIGDPITFTKTVMIP